MGEIADMMINGILDQNGEYTGMDLGYPYEFYHKKARNSPDLNKVITLCKQFGLRNRQKACEKILKYGTLFQLSTVSQTAKLICSGKDKTEWNKFKKWLKGGVE